MLRQNEEALSETNRRYFLIKNGRIAESEQELRMHYALDGGARDFYAKEHANPAT